MSAHSFFCPGCLVSWAPYQTDGGTCVNCHTGTIFRQEPVSEDAGTLHRAAVARRDAQERSERLHQEFEATLGCRCANDDCDQPATHNLLCQGCYEAADANVQALADLLDRLDAPPLLSTLQAIAGDCAEVKSGADAHRQASEIRALEDALDGGDTEAIDTEAIAKACELEALYDVPAWGEAA